MNSARTGSRLTLLYVDTSAALKRVLIEPQTARARELMESSTHLVSSALLSAELWRAHWRNPLDIPRAAIETLLQSFDLHAIDRTVVAHACRLPYPYLRSLDAIHLATALAFVPDISGLLTYDRRLAQAAQESGLTVLGVEIDASNAQ